MATQAQIDGNRQNAKKSTGPKTAKGKQVVARNAIKHGLCSLEAVIHGEEQEEYERHREAFLGELKPVGVMENMLAMRIVSLIWRLRRAEMMQNQAIDYKIVKVCDDTHFQMSQQLLPKAIRQNFAEMRELGSHLDLGRALFRDLSNQRVIERLLMYERRIESSMFRTMRELNKLQKARKDEQNRADSCRGRLARASRGRPAHDFAKDSESNSHTTGEQTSEDNRLDHHPKCDPLGGKLKNKPNRGRDALGTRGRDVRDTKQSQKPAPGPKSEALNPKLVLSNAEGSETRVAQHRKSDLKKQSQFPRARTSATLSVIKDYGNTPPAATEENKANKACPERSRMGRSSIRQEDADGTQAYGKAPGNAG